jgi:Putative transposase
LPATDAMSERRSAFAVLHTWTQQLLYHPHVHCLVTGGGVSDDGANWSPARQAFLVPVKALAKLVRGKLRAAFQKRRPDLFLPDAAWSKRFAAVRGGAFASIQFQKPSLSFQREGRSSRAVQIAALFWLLLTSASRR